ncbi:MAG: nuclease [Hydrogenophilales bacterium 16-64-46]|nr:MAG: nuclease [Hydrogenophilales bacterium 16-64-46]OZA40158.1 MAG: nuclease [Hydrogenophilales bacterium 17-64-34]HQT00435.1 thermonuclease family protein [Thiobacillus sp.]
MRCLICLLLLCLAATVRAETLTGVVIVVIDGDTVLFKPDHVTPASRAFLKVRLAGIDAPETGQPQGSAATQALKALLHKRRVVLTTLATDRYGRRVGQIEVDGADASQAMLARGLAWAGWRADAATRAREAEARQARRGLWREASPVPPWQWRRATQ